jgi:hypothetical protein
VSPGETMGILVKSLLIGPIVVYRAGSFAFNSSKS